MKRFLRNKKGGVSVAIAILMSTIILFSVVANVFIWEMALREEDIKRGKEELEIQHIYMNDNDFCIEIQNVGSITTHLVGLWINETRYSIDYYLNAEDKETIIETLSLDPESTLEVTIVTEKGNLVSETYSPEPTAEVKDSGVFKINWFYCKYTSLDNPTPIDAIFISKRADYVAFYLEVINNWIYPCTIREESFLTLVVAGLEPNLYIVRNATYDGTPELTIYENSNPLVIEPQESVVLVFASKYISSSKWKWKTTFPSMWGTSGTEGAGIQISIFFEINEDVYGQTISTHAIIVYKP